MKLEKIKRIFFRKKEEQKKTEVTTSKKQYSKHYAAKQYEYHSGKGKEYFLRGKQGYPLRITIGEAYQILNLRKIGYSVAKIYQSINWHHNVSESTIRTFLKNYEKGMFDKVMDEIQ